MADDATRLQSIQDSAAGPASISIDGQSTSEHPLPDQIAADKYVRATNAFKKAGSGILFQKLRPHGAVLNEEPPV